MAEISLVRDSGWVDRFRKYKVVVDGVCVGKIANGGSFTHQVASGEHTIRVEIDWCKTKRLSFSAGEAPVAFKVRSNLRGWKILLVTAYLVLPSRWIVLEAA
ncbi:hypothetical protein [Niveibacterium terrae]|uniref:hypothetical protein n=1 Tax=Niveibacterium terrae TaxID=3373598 RepID=UPI003A909614